MPPAKLPPYSTVIKARDVEDPVNVWLHRPLAYAFVALVYRTPLTPNQVTLLAMIFGLAAGSLWLVGSPTLMLVGGVLLWTSSILDGADGILARAKQMQSELGRALAGRARVGRPPARRPRRPPMRIRLSPRPERAAQEDAAARRGSRQAGCPPSHGL